MIPKIIHFVWLGGRKKPTVVQNAIKTWKRYAPDYKIMEWNEKNFDFSGNEFARCAYENKEYAFVSDYIRLAVLYEYGGIYLDADMYMVENLDYIAESDQLVFCREHTDIPFCCGFIAAVPHQEFIATAFDRYSGIKFDIGHLKANTQELSPLILKFYPFLEEGESNYQDGVHQFGRMEMLHPSAKSKLIHVGMASWGGENPVRQKLSIFVRTKLINKVRVRIVSKLFALARKVWKNPYGRFEDVE